VEEDGADNEVHALNVADGFVIPWVRNQYISQSLFKDLYRVGIIDQNKFSVAYRKF
jgi:hypothetical protein